jgi:hypothetical protein
MSSGLFEEAIADAKKIREVAEENAKKAVLEAVTPKIREFIESQILEQEVKDTSEGGHCASLREKEEDEDEDEKNESGCTGKSKPTSEEKEDSVKLDETAINALLDLIGEDIPKNNRSRDVMDLALSEAVSRLSPSERKKLFDMSQKIDNHVEKLNSRDLNTLKENNMQSREKYYEVDLETLREALDPENPMGEMLLEEEEDDAIADEMGDDGMLPEEQVKQAIEDMMAELGLDDEGDQLALDDDMGDDLGGEDDAGLDFSDLAGDDDIEMDSEAEDLNEVFDIDPDMLRQELSRVRRMSEASERGLAHESGGIAKDFEHHFGGKGSGNSKGGDFGGGKPGKDILAEMKHALRNQRRQNTSLQNKLTKYRSAVNTLREQLEELNLFNAKLLYVNKLLQNKTISESQKRSVVKALDEAKDLREAKVLYKSLTESFSKGSGSSRQNLNESIHRGTSSRTTRSANSVHSKASGEVDRWARLAGLK